METKNYKLVNFASNNGKGESQEIVLLEGSEQECLNRLEEIFESLTGSMFESFSWNPDNKSFNYLGGEALNNVQGHLEVIRK